jgi:hypothetical protein
MNISESMRPELSEDTDYQNTEKNPNFCCLTEGNEISDDNLPSQKTLTNRKLILCKNFCNSSFNALLPDNLINQQPITDCKKSTFIPSNFNKNFNELRLPNQGNILKPDSNRQNNKKNEMIEKNFPNKIVRNPNDKELSNNDNQEICKNKNDFAINMKNNVKIPNNNKPNVNKNFNQNNEFKDSPNVNGQNSHNILKNQNFHISQNNDTDHSNKIAESIRTNQNFGEYVTWLIDQDVPNLLKFNNNFLEFKDIISKKLKEIRSVKQSKENSNKINQSFAKYTRPKNLKDS